MMMEMVRRDGYAPPSPQCHCGDLLLNYPRMKQDDVTAALGGVAPPTSCFKGRCPAD